MFIKMGPLSILTFYNGSDGVFCFLLWTPTYAALIDATLVYFFKQENSSCAGHQSHHRDTVYLSGIHYYCLHDLKHRTNIVRMTRHLTGFCTTYYPFHELSTSLNLIFSALKFIFHLPIITPGMHISSDANMTTFKCHI